MHESRHIFDALRGVPLTVDVANGDITGMQSAANATRLPVIIPTLFDLQINGALGVDFSNPAITIEDVHRVVAHFAARHVGGMLATIITGPSDTSLQALANLARMREQDAFLKWFIAGVHLEGPYISGEDGARGAHPAEYVRDPDWGEFCRWQDAAGGAIRLMTLAPERAGAIDFIGKLCASSVACAIGHTTATAVIIQSAVQAGAKFTTHLGNGCAALLPRHDNPIWHQLAHDGLGASVILDGEHLPATLIKVFLKVKTPARLVLSCDSSPLAGLPAGRYRHWGQDVQISDTGRIGVAGTPYLAGSGADLWQCFRNAVDNFGVSLPDAVQMACINPRAWLGLPVPSLSDGEVWQDFSAIPDLTAQPPESPPSQP